VVCARAICCHNQIFDNFNQLSIRIIHLNYCFLNGSSLFRGWRGMAAVSSLLSCWRGRAAVSSLYSLREKDCLPLNWRKQSFGLFERWPYSMSWLCFTTIRCLPT
jgi:hypothetical protein